VETDAYNSVAFSEKFGVIVIAPEDIMGIDTRFMSPPYHNPRPHTSPWRRATRVRSR